MLYELSDSLSDLDLKMILKIPNDRESFDNIMKEIKIKPSTNSKIRQINSDNTNLVFYQDEYENWLIKDISMSNENANEITYPYTEKKYVATLLWDLKNVNGSRYLSVYYQ